MLHFMKAFSCQYVDMYLIHFSDYISLFEYTKTLLMDMLFNLLRLTFKPTLLYILLCDAGARALQTSFSQKASWLLVKNLSITGIRGRLEDRSKVKESVYPFVFYF